MAATSDEKRPVHSMKSTWRQDKSVWGPWHWLIHIVRLHHDNLNQDTPKHAKTDPVPYMKERSTHRWILMHALWPMALEWAILQYTQKPWGPWGAFGFYTLCMQINAIHHLWVLRRLGHIYGHFDGDKHARDGVPDVHVFKTLLSLILTTSVRPLLACYLSYEPTLTPKLSWWLPLELGCYSIVLDGWFYLYHRSCHESDLLWKYHRTHHLTKHPSPMLSSYADSEQEFLELGLIPVLSWFTLRYVFQFPMEFHDWWVCHEYIIFSEAFGHSGLRIYSFNPGAFTWLLKMLDMDLMIEDHDIHHRKGWKKSCNYGKQTRVWDTIFGTKGKRIEAIPEQVDYDKSFWMPWF